MESQVMWEPDTKRNTHMDRFRAAVASSCGLRLGERRAGAGGRALGLGAVLWLWGGRRGSASPGLALPRPSVYPHRGEVPAGCFDSPPGPEGTERCGLRAGCSACASRRGLRRSISRSVKVHAAGKCKQPYLLLVVLLLDVSPGNAGTGTRCALLPAPGHGRGPACGGFQGRVAVPKWLSV